jgi:hypothetical protein
MGIKLSNQKYSDTNKRFDFTVQWSRALYPTITFDVRILSRKEVDPKELKSMISKLIKKNPNDFKPATIEELSKNYPIDAYTTAFINP